VTLTLIGKFIDLPRIRQPAMFEPLFWTLPHDQAPNNPGGEIDHYQSKSGNQTLTGDT
jgi:hypothetical protein